MKQALVFVWLLAVSELMMQFKTCMIVMAAAWSLGFEVNGARRIFVALQRGKLRDCDSSEASWTNHRDAAN